MELLAPERTLTELDHVRLTNLTRRDICGGSDALNDPSIAGVLGLREGDVARWLTQAGDETAAEVLAILFQPEVSGDCSMQ